MAHVKSFALASAVAAVVANAADNCQRFTNDNYKLKGTLTNLYCTDADASCKSDKCYCASTCCEIDSTVNTCTTKSSSNSCNSTHFQIWDDSKSMIPVMADGSDFHARCCLQKKTCDVTCPSGYKDKANKANLVCAGATCMQNECCDRDGTCGEASGNRMCNNGKVIDTTLLDTVASDADYNTTCCKTPPSCSSSLCDEPGYKVKANFGAIDCASDTCMITECCDEDTAKCRFATGACADSVKEFKDPAMHNVFIGSRTFATVCCTTRGTCTDFKNYDYVDNSGVGQTSDAHESKRSTFLVLLAAFTFMNLMSGTASVTIL